jgi:hypothetical protein
VFEAGKRYTLEVDAGWPDAHGKPLAKGLRRELSVGPPAGSRIDVSAWKLSPPDGAAGALDVTFPAPLDAALAERELGVFDAAGKKVEGKVELLDGEKGWRFTPAEGWAAGEYRLRVGPDLEDLAGNGSIACSTPSGRPRASRCASGASSWGRGDRPSPFAERKVFGIRQAKTFRGAKGDDGLPAGSRRVMLPTHLGGPTR